MTKQRPSSRVAPKKAKPPARIARPAPKAAKAVRPAAKAPARSAAQAPAAKKTAARVAKKTAAPPAKKTAAPLTRAAAAATTAAKTPQKPAPPAAPAVNDRNLAVELFEKGCRAMQQRRFKEACEVFEAVIRQYADEKELIDRTRVYMAACNRQTTPPDATPTTFDERLYAATLSVNRGAYDEGLSLLSSLEREQPEHDHIQYLLAVVRTQRGEAEAALAHLQKAIDLRPSLRVQAGTDTDFEPLHDNEAFNTLLDPARLSVGRQRMGR